ncbi:MAG TPA: ABC transporter permease [Acidimicrobiales bacterium]|nr:ABC transporter permease [Acidimicrobiales bacterium]
MGSARVLLRRVNGPGVLTMLVLLGLWEALIRFGAIDFQNLPAPSAVAARSVDLVLSGELAGNVVHTLRVTLIGWTAASAVGIALGVLLGLWRPAWRWSMASIEVLRAVPPVALVPVAVLLFGFSVRMELLLIVYAGAWPVLINTIDGVRHVRTELLDVATMLRLSKLAALRKIVLPAAMPAIAVGLRLALSLALVLAVVAEMVGNPRGVGNALIAAQQALQPEEMFAYVFTIGLLGIGLNAVFRSVAARALPTPAPVRRRGR